MFWISLCAAPILKTSCGYVVCALKLMFAMTSVGSLPILCSSRIKFPKLLSPVGETMSVIGSAVAGSAPG